jgi:transposase, IS5 family
MYRMPKPQMDFEEFILPFPGKLRSDNRWVQLAKMIPWEELEKEYSQYFSSTGNPAKPLRVALGSLIIKEKCGFSDEETVEQITENPYLQYFLGFKEYQKEPPFTPSLMVFFRKRLTPELLGEINEILCQARKLKQKTKIKPPSSAAGSGSGKTGDSIKAEPTNQGKLLMDATCAPADIRYPTDLSLLNEAREKLEAMIDILYQPLQWQIAKPRTYRRKGRKAYLLISKQKKPRVQIMRKGVGKQLRFIARDLRIVERLSQFERAGRLSGIQQEKLSTIRILYQQQKTMYEEKTHSIADRIVSIHQPYVRPIVRGKAQNFTEFGAKVLVSLINGYSFLEKLSWDAFNEGSGLIEVVERYQDRYGCYPAVVQADKIFRNQENLRFCKEHNIRLSGGKLGRPVKELKAKDRWLARQDNRERNAIEGKFGEGKRCYGLGRVMAHLKETASSVIALQFVVMNLGKRLRVLFVSFLESKISGIFCLNPAFNQGKFNNLRVLRASA